MAATTTTVQVGATSPLTDAWATVLDLNDRATYYVDTISFAQPDKADVRSFTVRSPGETIQRVQYKNRKIECALWIRGATPAALVAAVHALIAAIEHPPYSVRLQPPGGANFTYADVVKVTHDIPFDAKVFLAGAIGTSKARVKITWECRPFFRGPRQWLANAVFNPGFEAPSGPGVTVFSDPFSNTNAYAVQAGGAPSLNPANTYVDVVMANVPAGGQLLRYYRLDEASGTSAFDISGNGSTATSASCTLGATGLIASDTDTAYGFNGSSSKVTDSGSGLGAGGAQAWSYGAWFKLAANPTSSNCIASIGSNVGGKASDLWVDSSGHLNAEIFVNGTITYTGVALTAGGVHHAMVTWDGTHLLLYLDGAQVASGTPTAPSWSANPAFSVGVDKGGGSFFNGTLDEPVLFQGALSSTQVTNLYNAGHSGATGTVANAMSLPSGGRVRFGSPAWGCVNTWSVRFRWLSTATEYDFYLHYTDANDVLFASVKPTQLGLTQTVGGTVNSLATATTVMVHEAWYWLQVTQFPSVSGNPPYVQATLANDNAGAVGATVATVAGPTSDAVTALVGQPQLAASGAALALGGLASGAGHSLALFGPGAWSFVGQQNAATGQASGAWDTTFGNPTVSSPTTYPSGPVTSFGAARMDLPPAGTVDSYWTTYTDGAPVSTYTLPVQSPGNVVQASAWVKSSGLSNTATVSLVAREYDFSGTFLRTTTLQTLTGNQSAWTQLAGSLTTGADCFYVGLRVRVVETTSGGSANGTVWLDNCQAWDATRTGMGGVGQPSMPYCELCFPQSPAQLMVSGLLGEGNAPLLVLSGGYVPLSELSTKLYFQLGRRLTATKGMQLVSPATGDLMHTTFFVRTQVLDATAYGGCYATYTPGGGSIFPTAVMPTAQDAAGVYHLLCRMWSNDSSPTALNSNIDTITLVNFEGFFGRVNEYEGPTIVNPGLTSASVWTTVDGGLVTLPPASAIRLADLTSILVNPLLVLTVTSGHTVTFRSSWLALLPVDGEIVLLTGTSNLGNQFTGQWNWFFIDGQNQASGFFSDSDFEAPVPSIVLGLGTNGPNTLISVAGAGDTMPTVDPTGGPGGLAGINQWLLRIGDDLAVGCQNATEMVYSPQYLWPQ